MLQRHGAMVTDGLGHLGKKNEQAREPCQVARRSNPSPAVGGGGRAPRSDELRAHPWVLETIWSEGLAVPPGIAGCSSSGDRTEARSGDFPRVIGQSPARAPRSPGIIPQTAGRHWRHGRQPPTRRPLMSSFVPVRPNLSPVRLSHQGGSHRNRKKRVTTAVSFLPIVLETRSEHPTHLRAMNSTPCGCPASCSHSPELHARFTVSQCPCQFWPPEMNERSSPALTGE